MAPIFNKIVSHTVALLLGATAASVALEQLKKENEEKIPVIDSSSKKDESTSTLPTLGGPIKIWNPNPNLLLAYDKRTKCALYSVERIVPRYNLDNSPRRDGRKFYKPQGIAEHHLPKEGFYRKTGFDKGHCAAAANHTNESDYNDTFCMSNIFPQNARMNREAWAGLENLVRKQADILQREVISVTGAIWLPSNLVPAEKPGNRDLLQFQSLAFGNPPDIIHVPTHLYKLFYTENTDEKGKKYIDNFAAFVIPNDDSFRKRNSLADYVVRPTELEAVTGLSFFSDYSQDLDSFDLVTEKFWSKQVVNVNQLTNDSLQGSNIQQLSKNKKKYVNKKLGEIDKYQIIPNHFCHDGACSKIRFKKK